MKKLLAILGSIGLTSTAASAVIACGNGGNANVGGDKSIVVNSDVTNGSYNSDSKTFTAQYGSDKYQAHKMSFSLTKVVLKAENIHVVNSQGTNVDQATGLWSFTSSGKDTVFQINDSSLNGATIQIDLANHLPTVFKIAIHQDQNIIVNNVINGSYEVTTKTFTAEHPSSQYSENRMHFSLTNVSLNESNFNVIKSDGTKTAVKDKLWSFVVTNNTTTVHIDDYHLDQATIEINLDGYNSITFKIVINQDKEIAISNSVANGSYNSDSKTFTASYPSAQYGNHKMSFTVNDLVLNANNVVIKANDGQEVTSGWSRSTTTNTTTITIDDYHLDQATIEIKNVDGYWPITLKVVIPQDKNLVVGNVTNGGYNANTKTFTTAYGSSAYQGHEISFALSGVVLTTNNILVKDSEGTVNTSGWSFATNEESTTITIDDYHLDQATIEIKDVDGYWPIVFNININQDQNIIVNSIVSNGKYDDVTKTFTADYRSSKYDGNNLLFSLKVLVSTEQKIVVKDANGQVIEQASDRWSFWTSDDGVNTVIDIKDGSMDGATIEIKDVDGYWPVTFNITILQDKHFVIEDVTNGNYNEATKTLTATYGNSTYQEEGHEMNFKIKGLTLQGKDFVHVKDNSNQEITTGWNLATSGNDTIITINDNSLNNTKVIVQNVDGYWPGVFNVVIPQDQIFSPDVTNGKYDDSTKTLTATYGNSTYGEKDHEMSFALNGVDLSADNIVVKNSAGQGVAQNSGWSFATDGGNTTITIDDYNLNGATISIQDVDGYWPATFNVAIPQDQNVVVNSDVSHGKYDDATKTLTADYESDQYDSNSDHNMYFSLYNLNLNEDNIIVKDVDGDIVDMATDRWGFWTSFDDKREVTNTVFQIKDSKLNGATIEIKNVKGYWPITLKIVINQSQK